MIITTASTALTPLFAWWFVAQQGLGLEGAAYSYVAVQVGMHVLYIYVVNAGAAECKGETVDMRVGIP